MYTFGIDPARGPDESIVVIARVDRATGDLHIEHAARLDVAYDLLTQAHTLLRQVSARLEARLTPPAPAP